MERKGFLIAYCQSRKLRNCILFLACLGKSLSKYLNSGDQTEKRTKNMMENKSLTSFLTSYQDLGSIMGKVWVWLEHRDFMTGENEEGKKTHGLENEVMSQKPQRNRGKGESTSWREKVSYREK